VVWRWSALSFLWALFLVDGTHREMEALVSSSTAPLGWSRSLREPKTKNVCVNL